MKKQRAEAAAVPQRDQLWTSCLLRKNGEDWRQGPRARCGPGAGTLNRRSPAGRVEGGRASGRRGARAERGYGTKRKGWCACRAAGNGANDDANPYGNRLAIEPDPAIAEAGRAVRSS